jgi:hypothetical protein
VRLRILTLLSSLALAIPAVAGAQDFGILNSAETINRGNFKLTGAPVVVFGKNGADNDAGVSVSGGYGFTDRFDLEGRAAFFDGVKFFGADAEYWFLKGRQVNVSGAAGFHVGNGDNRFDTTGIDLTFLASGQVAPRLELYGGLDLAFNSINDDFIDGDYTTVHIVPGIEYRIAEDIDLVAEFGIGVNDDSHHYLAGGLAFYFR